MTVMPTIPPQMAPVSCLAGHTLHRRNTALDMDGTLICLECVMIVNEAHDDVMGRLIAVMLNLAPMPSRAEVQS